MWLLLPLLRFSFTREQGLTPMRSLSGIFKKTLWNLRNASQKTGNGADLAHPPAAC
jgi:hypothetical protein